MTKIIDNLKEQLNADKTRCEETISNLIQLIANATKIDPANPDSNDIGETIVSHSEAIKKTKHQLEVVDFYIIKIKILQKDFRTLRKEQ